MSWIRNLETLASGRQQYTVKYELGSECYIPGLLDYAEGKIIRAPVSTEQSRDGLWPYPIPEPYFCFRRIRQQHRQAFTSSSDAAKCSDVPAA